MSLPKEESSIFRNTILCLYNVRHLRYYLFKNGWLESQNWKTKFWNSTQDSTKKQSEIQTLNERFSSQNDVDRTLVFKSMTSYKWSTYGSSTTAKNYPFKVTYFPSFIQSVDLFVLFWSLQLFSQWWKVSLKYRSSHFSSLIIVDLSVWKSSSKHEFQFSKSP